MACCPAAADEVLDDRVGVGGGRPGDADLAGADAGDWAVGDAGMREFLALLQLDDGIENPLPGIEAARELQATVARWATGPALVPQPVEVLGDYRMLGQKNE